MIFTNDIFKASHAHVQSIALDSGHEACGVVAGDCYHPIKNIHPQPEVGFCLDPKQLAKVEKKFGPIQGVVHSHVDGSRFPSLSDMENQIKTNVPWLVHVFLGGACKGMFHWGDHRLGDDLIGRRWLPCVSDCFSLIRSYFWQNHQILLPDFPREDDWWNQIDTTKELAKRIDDYPMFVEVKDGTLRKDDVILMAIRSEQPNHFAVMWDDQTLLHHPAEGLSSRRSIGMLQGTVKHIYRLKE